MSDTEHYGLPKPDDNPIDKQSLVAALLAVALATDMVDELIHGLALAVGSRADKDHTHAMEAIEGLVDALASKMEANAAFSLGDLDGVDLPSSIPNGYILAFVVDRWIAASAASVLGNHEHSIGQIAQLAQVLDSKASASAVTSALSGKLNTDASNVGNATARAAFRAAIGAISASDVPSVSNLDASVISGGTFDQARIPSLNASKINAGAFDPARIPNLDASKITSGIWPIARGGTGQSTEAGMRGVYTGTASGNTAFPVGSMLMVAVSDNSDARNGTVTVRLAATGNTYSGSGGTGSVLAGTWRHRGAMTAGAATYILCQRVA